MDDQLETMTSSSVCGAVQEAEARFQALSEEEQVLSLLSARLGAVRGFARSYEEQLANAREFIAGSYGPKFADRVLGDAQALRTLHLAREEFRPFVPSGPCVRGH